MKIPELPKRPADSHKGSYGKLLIIAGSRGMIGAGCLAAKAALRSGCGLVYLAMPETAQKIAASQVLGALTIPLPETEESTISLKAYDKILENFTDKDCIAIGPGLGTHAETIELVNKLLMTELKAPVVIDADGLNALSQNTETLRKASEINKIVITPHPGEFARLTNQTVSEIQADRELAANNFARDFADLTLILKGHKTIVRQNEKNYVNSTGNAGLAKGGSGDVLTGLLAGFITQGMSNFEASVLAVCLHGVAAEIASEELTQYCMTAEDLISFLSEAFKKHLKQKY